MEHFVPDLPEQFDSFGEARKNGFLKVRSIKEAGGRVAGIFCTFTPLEILDAAGFLPVSLCGMSDEVIPAAEAARSSSPATVLPSARSVPTPTLPT